MKHLIAAVSMVSLLTVAHTAAGQTRVDRNVVYGMYSGLALLMDVHRPERPNGYGVIFVAGNAWQAPLAYGAPGLKDSQVSDWGPPLLAAGYTVFAVNHRAAPRFHYPAQIDDIQRAIRFVRHHAAEYGVNPARLGGLGGSSGAHLIGLAAGVGAPGLTGDSDPVNRQDATLQCVVLRAGPTDMRKMIGGNGIATGAVVSLLDRLPTPFPEEQALYRAASPVSHVKASSPPTLLLHGDADDTIPVDQSVALETALRAVNVPVKLVRVIGGAHGSDFGTNGKPHAQFPDVLKDTVSWFDQYLKAPR
jgi:acetyl esterase/lipase